MPPVSRRELLRIAALTGVAPSAAALVACGDDTTSDGDTSADVGLSDVDPADADAGRADTGQADTGADITTDPEPEVFVPDDLPEYAYDGPLGPEDLFAHSVASGDPLPDAVILWTHVSLSDDDGPSDEPVDVWWEIAVDPDFVQRVQVGTASAAPERDFTVKVDVGELEAGRTYYYQFKALGRTSPVGRTRTAPSGRVDNLRFAVVSCASYTSGYYHAYRSIAERADLHAVLHLGDYIYEGGSRYLQLVDERENVPAHEITTLADYRTRYAHYRSDADLQEVHRQHPMIAVWDDHEIVNNAYRDGAESHSESEGDYQQRKRNAWIAWTEWMPTRETDQELKIWRGFQYGDLAEILMLDTRIWERDTPVTRGNMDGIDDPERSILGDDQATWLDERLCNTSARWKLVGQQVMMAPWLVGGSPLNPDAWDGYPGSRERFLRNLDTCRVDDVVVLTGDIHSTWASNLALDPHDPEAYDPETGDGSLAVEMVCTSVTTQSVGALDGIPVEQVFIDNNPHMQWVELSKKGYLVLDLNHERAQGAWFHFDDVREPNRADAGEAFARAYSTATGRNRLQQDDAPAPDAYTPPPAP